MDTALSLSFIAGQGTPLEGARIRTILYGVTQSSDLVRPFVSLQNDDGGFPYAMQAGCLSTLNDTHVALGWLDDLAMLESPTAVKAGRYLLDMQRDDGGWDEDPAILRYDVLPWAIPGDLRARVYLSFCSAYWLALTGHVAHPAFQEALDFLLQYQDETGKFYGFLHSTWIATSVFAMAGPRYTAVVENGLRALDSRPLSEWADSQISWALAFLGRAGVPAEHHFVAKCLDELTRRQQADGSWGSEDGEAFAVGATIEALKVLKHYRRLSAGRDS